jgi:fermentation-respiration switch protein FrsA (DUF1100 family)
MIFRAHHLVALILAFAGCSAEQGAPSSAAPPSTPAPDASAEVRANVRFLAERDGADVEVSSIVYTERFIVRIDGLRAGGEATLTAHMYTPGTKGRGYTSSATFLAGADGTIDTSKTPALRGSYTGVDPDAVFWSMKEGPLAEGLGPDRRAAFFEVMVDDVVVGRGALERLAMKENVKVEQVTADGLVGELFMPEAAVDRIPVVAFGGSEGGIYGGEGYAMQLASWGHPTLALAYFGAPGVPPELSEIPLEYFAKAFAWLDARPETRKGKAIVIGGSRGGELALLLGATFPNVAGVIAETPSSYRWAGLELEPKPAWTFEGKPLAFVPDSNTGMPATVKTPAGKPAYVLRPLFEQSLEKAPAEALEAARIRVEDVAGPVLMLAGADDQMWPACDFVERAMTRLTASGHAAKHTDEGVCFPAAGHSVGSTGLPMADSMWASIGATSYALGGTPAGNAHAGRAAEQKIKAFLARVTK